MSTNTLARFALITLITIVATGCASSGGHHNLSPEDAAALQVQQESYELRYRKALEEQRAAMRRASEPGAQVVAATKAFVRQGEEICGDFHGEQRVQVDSRASQQGGTGANYSVRSNVGTRCGRKFGSNSE